MSELNIDNVVETNLAIDNDYQIECVQVEPDSVYGQDKSYCLDR